MSDLFNKLGSSTTTTHLNNVTSHPSPSLTKSIETRSDITTSSINSTTDDLIATLTHSIQPESKPKPFFKDNITRFSLLNKNNRLDQPDINKNLQRTNNRNSGIGRDYWLDDASALKCRSCDKKFTTFLRKHHCRICGKIFCASCTTFIDGAKFNHNGSMRVCLICNKLADRYEDEIFSSDDEDEDEEEVDENDNASNNNNELLNNKSKPIETKNMPNTFNEEDLVTDNILQDANTIYQNNQLVHGQPGPDNSNKMVPSKPWPHLKPPMMAIPTTRQGGIVEIKSAAINSSNLEQTNDGSDEETELISFMNNHQFNWPNSADSKSTASTKNGNDYSNNYSTNSTQHFLTKVNTYKSSSTAVLNSSMNQNKSNRRRMFSNRYKNRKGSKTFITNTTNKGSSNDSSNVEFYDDFQKIGEKYATSLLNELLIDKNITNYEDWTEILIKALKKISNIEIDLKSMVSSDSVYSDSNYNFSNYIKIKKILGDSMKRTKTIEGIMFSKKLPLKAMRSKINNPKIMLITFPIQYDQDINNKHHFQSLESIIAQQDQYIKKLVDRIVKLQPTIILSSNSINGLALDIFANLNITVVPDCKLSNLIKLSKFTDATIITSIDILAMNPKLGTCGLFEVLNFKFQMVVKSYLLFDECPNKVGVTLVLRDSDDEVLTKVKACLMIMMFAFTNIKLESSFLRDQCLKVVEDSGDIEFIAPENILPLYSFEMTGYEDFIELIKTRLISISPWVKFDHPMIIKQLENIKNNIKINQETYDRFLTTKENEKDIWKSDFDLENVSITTENYSKLVLAIKTYRENDLNLDFNILLKKWDQFWKSRELTFFDPNYNQNIFTLFSMISKKNSTPCIGPEIQLIDFYWENDYSLGQFIENMCSTADNICNRNCQLALKDHYRSYVHDDGKIDIFIEENNLNVSSNTIMNWSVCKNCLNSTPVLPLNDVSYKYSFGKFMELLFWFNTAFEFKILNNNNDCQCNVNNKDFDFFKDYIHYYSFKNYKLRLEYNKIQNLTLVIPKFELFWNPKHGYEIKEDHYHDIKSKSLNFFASVYDRLARIKLDGTNLSTTEIKEGNNKLEELKEKLKIQEIDISLLLSTVYSNSNIDEHLKLNVIVREVQELSSFWNHEFQAFAKAYLPSEKDVKKITAFQLDRLFKSLAGKDEYESDEEKNNEVSTPDDNGTLPDVRPIQETTLQSPKKHKSQLILNKIHQLNRNQSEDLFWIAPSKNSEEQFDAGKVKQLTNFFDTQEYFNQRELEKLKLENSSKYTPKVSSMKPKIEIYKSATDAVNAEESKPNVEESTNAEVVEQNGIDVSQGETENDKEIQPEKVSILKSLTHFWADRSATLWEPLYYPLSPSEHIFVDSDVIVREDEPSSIISFCLSTTDYERKLNSKSMTARDTDLAEVDENEKNDSKQKDASEFASYKDEGSKSECEQALEQTMLKKGFHLKYQFEEGYSTILCKIFFTQQFDALRRKCGVSSNYIESLARCVKWDSTGGKSGSAFLKTLDQRFIIKELSKAELEAFVHFAPSYFEYFAHVLFHDLPSVLVKIFGFYQIQVKNTLPNSKSYTMDILIMENLFYDRKIDRIFDLKGSMRNRHVEQTGKENEVLLDENMVEYIYESPLFVKENDKRLLRASLWNDTLFLEKMNVMDYSLVVGLDHSKNELVVGIIDCIRTFTWDKKLESWVKEKGLVGNTGVGKEPTVITPKQYKTRFREAMERYFLMSPGVYYQGTINSA